jgi:hypothetical protein
MNISFDKINQESARVGSSTEREAMDDPWLITPADDV